MDALCSPGMQHIPLPQPNLAATLSTADVEDLQKSVAVCDQKGRRELSTPPKLMHAEVWKQSEVGDAALTSFTGSVDSASQLSGISPTVGAYTAQCAQCMKWRFIPTKAHFEVIRHSLIEKPFFCSSATSWNPHASCDDPFEISPDLHELWAFDKPGIPLPPDGWERLLVIRPAGSIKFADVYYVTPSGKKLRSMPEIERFLSEHPEHVCRGVKSSWFSFLIPRPLDKEYCRKKNDSLTCGEKSKSLVTDAHLNKLGLVPFSFKVVSLKPKPEKLQFRKKAGSGVSPGGESQVLCSEKRSSGIVDCQQATRSPFTSQGLAIMTVTNGATPTAGSKEIKSSFVEICADSTS